MKFNIPLAGSVSPCVRLFLESLILDVEDESLLWPCEGEPGGTTPARFVVMDEAKRESRAARSNT